ncbi:MAG: aspartate carbamoyltransferase catalytic subunit [Planctomycetes bacterium]|nr:aspartate carbamoyltransferase catalytic subunit [Planctomycetota bacterium]
MKWTRKHLLGLEDLSAEEIMHVLETADSFKEVSTRSIKKVPALRGKTVVTLFFEPSTRTTTSFGLAARRLSADVISVGGQMSSSVKGETLVDTARNVEAMGVDIMVVRHQAAGAPLLLSQKLDCSVVNAGDGAHEHPTQGLLDIYTIREMCGKLEGLKVGIVGDITHSRVARSDIWGLQKLGAEVFVTGPATLVPKDIDKLGATVIDDMDTLVETCDVINMLRIQFERQEEAYLPSAREYSRLFGLNAKRMQKAKPNVIIMHPGPINRGLEISPEVADGNKSVILRQVTNGLAVRMAVLYLVAGSE